MIFILTKNHPSSVLAWISKQMAVVYQQSFHTTPQTIWSAQWFYEQLEQDALIVVKTAPDSETLIGFIMGKKMVDHYDILTFAVQPDYQGQGYGYALLQEYLGVLDAPCFLEVCTHNNKAIALYHKAGFKSVGIRANYYACLDTKTGPKGPQDAIVMRYEPPHLIQHDYTYNPDNPTT